MDIQYKYHRHSIRLKGFDYSLNGAYFVTICAKDRQEIFGDIVDGNMILNNLGKIVESVWYSLPDHHNVELDTFQIMPNHVHLIIVIDNSGRMEYRQTLGQIVAYFKYQSTKQINAIVGARFSRPAQWGGNNPAPTDKQPYPKIWQRNYFEHIIRDEIELDKIREYIINNPLMWDRDRNNPEAKENLTPINPALRDSVFKSARIEL